MSSSRQYVELLLTCEDQAEADKIATALLESHLIACAKTLPIDARYWWQGEITTGHEVMLVMESAVDLFDEAEAKVAELHSYDTFVLQALPFHRVSDKATTWLEENLKAMAVERS